MNQRGFSQIILLLIVAVVLALGAPVIFEDLYHEMRQVPTGGLVSELLSSDMESCGAANMSSTDSVVVARVTDSLEVPASGAGVIVGKFAICPTSVPVDISQITFDVLHQYRLEPYTLHNVTLYTYLVPGGSESKTWYSNIPNDFDTTHEEVNYVLSDPVFPIGSSRPASISIHVPATSTLIAQLIADVTPSTPGHYQSPFRLIGVSLRGTSSVDYFNWQQKEGNWIVGEPLDVVAGTYSGYASIARFGLASPGLPGGEKSFPGQTATSAIFDFAAPNVKDLGIRGMDVRLAVFHWSGAWNGGQKSDFENSKPQLYITGGSLWEDGRMVGVAKTEEDVNDQNLAWLRFRNIYFEVPKAQHKVLALRLDITNQAYPHDQLWINTDANHIVTFGETSADVIPITGSAVARVVISESSSTPPIIVNPLSWLTVTKLIRQCKVEKIEVFDSRIGSYGVITLRSNNQSMEVPVGEPRPSDNELQNEVDEASSTCGAVPFHSSFNEAL